MNQPLLSIIIPMYNTAPYIERCIRSLYPNGLDQSLFEVIVVDDGSIDDGVEKVELLQQEFSNIRLISQENLGLSEARNAGMKAVNGKYLYFLDSDDYLFTFQTILNKAIVSSSDVITFAAQKVSDSGRGAVLSLHLPKNTSCTYTSDAYLSVSIPETIVWLSLYRTDFIRKNKLHFFPNKLCEDIYFSLTVLLSDPVYEFSEEIVYAYWQRPESITNRRNNQQLQDDSLDQIEYFLNQNKIPDSHPIYKKLYYLTVSLLVNIYRYDMTHQQLWELIDRLRPLNLYPLPFQLAYPFKYNLFRVVANYPTLFWYLRKTFKLIY